MELAASLGQMVAPRVLPCASAHRCAPARPSPLLPHLSSGRPAAAAVTACAALLNRNPTAYMFLSHTCCLHRHACAALTMHVAGCSERALVKCSATSQGAKRGRGGGARMPPTTSSPSPLHLLCVGFDFWTPAAASPHPWALQQRGHAVHPTTAVLPARPHGRQPTVAVDGQASPISTDMGGGPSPAANIRDPPCPQAPCEAGGAPREHRRAREEQPWRTAAPARRGGGAVRAQPAALGAHFPGRGHWRRDPCDACRLRLPLRRGAALPGEVWLHSCQRLGAGRG